MRVFDSGIDEIMTIGVYPGSFDPLTTGHLDILNTATKIFSEVIVAIGTNPNKQGLFTVEERTQHIRSVCQKHKLDNVCVNSFDGLLVEYCNDIAACQTESKNIVIVRGLRAVSDFEQEMAIAHINAHLNDKYPTVFIPSSAEKAFISSSAVKQLALFTNYNYNKKQLEQYVDPDIVFDLIQRVKDKY